MKRILSLITITACVVMAYTTQAQVTWVKQMGPYGGNIREVAIHPTSGALYALTYNDSYGAGFLFKSTDQGNNWTAHAPAPLSSETDGFTDIKMMVDGTLLALSRDNLYSTTDDGVTWTKLNSTQGSETTGFDGGREVAKIPTTGTLIVFGYDYTDTEYKVFRSTNNGSTWQKGSNFSGYSASHFVVTSTGNVYAAAGSNLWLSTNDGAAFTQLTTSTSPSVPIDFINAIDNLVAKSNGSQIFLTTRNTNGTIYSLVSPFTTWVAVTETGIDDASSYYGDNSELEISPDNSRLFLIDNSFNKVYYNNATAAGTWTKTNSAFLDASGSNVNHVAARDNNTLYASSEKFGVWKSVNAGAGWNEINTGIEAINMNSMTVADNGNLIVAGQGAYRTPNDGLSWTRITQAAGNYEVIKATTGTPKTLLLMSESGSSSFRSTDNGVNWVVLPAPPGNDFTSVDGTKILSYSSSNLYYTYNQGTTWSAALAISGTDFPSSRYFEKVAIDQNGIIYTYLYNYSNSTREFWKIVPGAGSPPTTATATKIQLSTIGTTNDVSDIKFLNNKIYVLGSSNSGRIVSATSDAGISWVPKSAPNGSFRLDVNPTNNYIFLSSSSGGNFSVHLSRDEGNTFEAFPLGLNTDKFTMYGVQLNTNGIAFAGINGSSIHKTSGTVVTPLAPGAFTTVATSKDRVTLRFVDNATNEDSFELERFDGTNWIPVESTYDRYLTGEKIYVEIRGLQPETTYQFRVYAKNTAGNSPTVSTSATTLAACASTIPDNKSWGGTINASPISNISIKSLGNGIYSISELIQGAGVSGNSNATGKFIETCGFTYISPDDPLQPGQNGTWNGTTLVLKWVTMGITPEVAGTVTLTQQGSDPAPAPPSLTTAYIYGNTSIEIRWVGSAFETAYIVERSTSNTFTTIDRTINVTYPSTAVVDNVGLINGTTYYYRVRATNTAGSSTNSNTASVALTPPNFILSNTLISNTLSFSTSGFIWGDFDNDGNEDAVVPLLTFFADQSSVPLLFRNNGAGDFTQVNSSGIEPSKYIIGSAGDYNNDGNLDLFLTVIGGTSYLYSGNGNFTFTKVLSSPILEGGGEDLEDIDLGAAWADIDNNGLLDMVVVPSRDIRTTKLFVQSPVGTFTKQTTGVLSNSVVRGNTTVWADYDNDGDQDLFMTNSASGGTNKLFRNDGTGSFTLVTGAPFDTDVNPRSNSASWGDYNNDGFLDLFITADGNNLLYRNNGNGTFVKQSFPASITETNAYDTYGCAWGDINNDGFLDLITTNLGGENIIYINNNGTTFTKRVNEKINDIKIENYGMSLVDYDKNGFLDASLSLLDFATLDENSIAGTPATQSNFLFKNNNTTGNWAEFSLQGTVSNKSAIGTRITLVAGGKTQIREVQSTTSFAGQNSGIVHFGLGAATTITSVQFKWPSGIIQTLTNVAPNGIIEIIEDNTGPVITQNIPAHTATEINANTTLAITLNEEASAVASRNVRIFKTTDLVNPVATVAVTSAVKTGNTFTFTLAQKLENSTSYSISIEAGAFKDIYGNDFAGLASSAWQFTTTAGPSATLLSPANNANNVSVTTALEITFNKAVTGVAGKSVDVLIQGSSEPEFSIDAATGTIAGNKITFTIPSALEFQTLYDVVVEAGAFTDNFSNASNQINWSFLTVDNVAPVVTFTAPTSINKGTATTFSPLVTDNSGEIQNAVLHYRKIAVSAFSTLAGVLNSGVANQYDFAIPATFFDETGLEYYFTATDLSGNEVRSPAGTNTHKLLVSYSLVDSEIPSGQLGFGGNESGWKIFAIPFELGNSNSINSIFDELTGLENKIDFRFLKYKDQTSWAEFPSDFSTITRGEGYFINIKAAEDIQIGEGILAPQNDRNNLFQIALKQGWNMIGNPYLSAISWADVSAYNTLTGTNAVLVKYTSGQYSQTNQNLLPFEGGLVFASAAATISIPFAGQTNSNVRRNEAVFTEGDWLMPLTIRNGEFENTFGGIGMHKLADNSFDQFDAVNPPRFFEFSEVNFSHPEHFAKNFSRDVVPTANKHIWEFTVATNQGSSATLTWNNSGLANLEQQLYLFDEALQKPVDMRSQSYYTFNTKESSRFRIYFGENVLNEMLPNMFSLGKAYPNPSADVVLLPFSLPEAGGVQQQVVVEVIDAMGRSLGTILQKAFAPGYHTFEWNGAQVIDKDGLYIFKVVVDNQQGKQIQQTRILLKK